MSRIQRYLAASPENLKSILPSLKPTEYRDPNASKSNHNIRSIAWNPLGTWVATGCADRTLRVWNVDKPNVRQSTELRGHTSAIEKVAFNPVKELELCSVCSDGSVRFWDVRTRTIINEIRGLGDAFTLAWAPDGERLIVGTRSNKLFVLSPTQNTPLSEHQQTMDTNQVVFDWSGQRVFVTTGEGRIRILDFPSFEPAFRHDYQDAAESEFMLVGHTSSCIAAELHPYNRYLATGGSDSLISIFDTAEWNCQRTITKLVGPVRGISFSFCGRYIVGGTDAGTGIEIFYIETGEHLCTFKTSSSCPIVVWGPNRYALAYSEFGMLKIISFRGSLEKPAPK